MKRQKGNWKNCYRVSVDRLGYVSRQELILLSVLILVMSWKLSLRALSSDRLKGTSDLTAVHSFIFGVGTRWKI